MKNYGKRIASFALAFLLCAVVMLGNVNAAKATEVTTEETEMAEEYITILAEYGRISANTEVVYNVSLDANKEVGFTFFVPHQVDLEMVIYDSADYVYSQWNVTADEWYYQEETDDYGILLTEYDMPVGDYSVGIVMSQTTDFEMYVDFCEPDPMISQTMMTLTAGMKDKLTVDYTDEKITWKSSKKSVATVTAKGVVTAKKAGTATITATTESGEVFKCKVTVKANKFTETKYTINDLKQNDLKAIIQMYSASYDSNGNLVMKCRFINNCGYKVTELEDLEIVMLTDEGKEIGKYAVESKKIVVANGSSKDFDIMIKKSELKIKKADLRNADYDTDGIYVYYY